MVPIGLQDKELSITSFFFLIYYGFYLRVQFSYKTL